MKKESDKFRNKINTARLELLRLSATRGVLEIGNHRFPVAIGRSGVIAAKREGDGGTPFGRWVLREVYYRPDRLNRPPTVHRCIPLTPQQGWCDASGDRNYNRAVVMPYAASAEALWRPDHLYDLIAVLGYNDVPRSQGAGSAIFMHIARDGMRPTEGCIAMKRDDLLRFLAAIGPKATIVIGDSNRPSSAAALDSNKGRPPVSRWQASSRRWLPRV